MRRCQSVSCRLLAPGTLRMEEPEVIAIVDYGMGNLRSVEKALEKLGHAAAITSDPGEVVRAERVVLPGVGAFGAAMANLTRAEKGSFPLAEAVREAVTAGKPFLGICL